jgi:hypothetical protein
MLPNGNDGVGTPFNTATKTTLSTESQADLSLALGPEAFAVEQLDTANPIKRATIATTALLMSDPYHSRPS